MYLAPTTMKILLADDDEDRRNALEDFLASRFPEAQLRYPNGDPEGVISPSDESSDLLDPNFLENHDLVLVRLSVPLETCRKSDRARMPIALGVHQLMAGTVSPTKIGILSDPDVPNDVMLFPTIREVSGRIWIAEVDRRRGKKDNDWISLFERIMDAVPV